MAPGRTHAAVSVINIAHFDFASYIIENKVQDGVQMALQACAVHRAATLPDPCD